MGDTQSMIFKEPDLPPIFKPDAPRYDIAVEGTNVTRKFTKPELKAKLEATGFNGEGKVDVLRTRTQEANIPLTETNMKYVEGYVNKPKGVAQIACKREFVNLEGNLPNGTKFSMNGKPLTDELTGVTSLDKSTSVVRMLGKCNNF